MWSKRSKGVNTPEQATDSSHLVHSSAKDVNAVMNI